MTQSCRCLRFPRGGSHGFEFLRSDNVAQVPAASHAALRPNVAALPVLPSERCRAAVLVCVAECCDELNSVAVALLLPYVRPTHAPHQRPPPHVATRLRHVLAPARRRACEGGVRGGHVRGGGGGVEGVQSRQLEGGRVEEGRGHAATDL